MGKRTILNVYYIRTVCKEKVFNGEVSAQITVTQTKMFLCYENLKIVPLELGSLNF